jgi:hypothetical protein
MPDVAGKGGEGAPVAPERSPQLPTPPGRVRQRPQPEPATADGTGRRRPDHARPRPRTPGNRFRQVPKIIWLIVVLQLGVVLCQSALFPNFRSPDERQHMDMIAQVAEHTWPWSTKGRLSLQQGSRAGGFAPGRTGRRPQLAEHPPPERAHRPSYDQAGGATAERRDITYNQMIQHPPLYYLMGAAVVSALPNWRGIPFDRVLLIMRWFDAFLLAGIPLLLWAAARRLGLPAPLPTAAALVPLAIPEFTHMESAVNNDDLLILLGATLTVLLVGVIAGDTRRRTALAIGVVTSLALLTKGLALVFPLWLVLAYLLAIRRSTPRAALGSLGIAAAASLPGLSWWINNKIQIGTVQPHSANAPVVSRPALHSMFRDGPAWSTHFIERMNTIFFVHDQEKEYLHNTSWTLAVVAGSLVLVGICATLVLRSLPWLTTTFLLVPVVGMLTIVAKGSWESYTTFNLDTAAMQGRYLYGGLVGLMLAALAGLARLPDRIRRFAPLAVFGFASLIQAAYVWYTVVLIWAPVNTTGSAALIRGASGIIRWYPLPPVTIAVFVSVSVVAAVLVLAGLIRSARRSDDTADRAALSR